MTVAASTTAFVARQPIFDRRCRLLAYELLFRAGPENVFSGDLDDGSAGVIAHGSLLTDIQRLVAGRDAFINLTEEVLERRLYRVLPAETTVLELLETIEPTDAVIDACREARKAGYRIALDDVLDGERLEPFGDVVDLVKVDLLDAAPDALANLEERARRIGMPLLAEKVETEAEFEAVRKRGYELFQGFFLGRPKMMQTTDIPANKFAMLELLRELNQAELDPERLEGLIKGDVALCYKLLRYINAVRFGFRDPVRSVHRAIVLLGVEEMRRWASLAALATVSDGRPPMLIQQALTRGRFYELLAPIHGLDEHREELFLAGILSMIDAVLKRPLDEVIGSLPVEPEVQQALLERTGPLASTHRFALAYEAGRWDEAHRERPHDDAEAVTGAYLDAVEWAERYASVARLHD